MACYQASHCIVAFGGERAVREGVGDNDDDGNDDDDDDSGTV